MILSNQQLTRLTNIAVSAAKEAGQLISKFTDKKVNIASKCGGNTLASQVVTEVDFLSQNIILEKLTPSCEEFDIGLLTEEKNDDFSRLEKDYFWCIDPLDGTLPFIEQSSGYAVSIALVSKNGTPQIGVVYDPVTATLYHAIKGQGSFINGINLSLSKQVSKSINFITDRSFIKTEKFPEIFEKLSNQIKGLGYDDLKLTKHGGAVMNACWVLETAPAVYFKFPKPHDGGGSLWDYAATACIFTELGAIATDIHGKPLDLNRHDSTFMNHQGILYASDKKIAAQTRTLFSEFHKDIT